MEDVALKTIPLKQHSLVAMKSKSSIFFSKGENIINMPGQYQDSAWDLMVVQNIIKQRFSLKI